ncbi:MAG: redoxin domain-containing protein [Acidimicrobiia bacterium]|nr:redoxin domain-containing protein [Acidimicrobiia bacterium]
MEPNEDPPASRRGPSRRLLWVLAVLAFLSTGIAAYAWTQGQEQVPEVPEQVSLQDLTTTELGANDVAPNFTVPTLDGTPFSLSRHMEAEGTPVLLNLWASWCTPCRAEMPALEAAAGRHPNVKVVGVAVQDDNVAAERFARELGVTYTIGLDERDEVNALYSTPGLPVTFVISPEGVILQTIFGELDEARIDATIATWFGG